MAFEDSVKAWQAAVDNGLIQGDPKYYSGDVDDMGNTILEPAAQPDEYHHALLVAILEAHGIDWQSGDQPEPPPPPPDSPFRVGMTWQWQIGTTPSEADLDQYPADVYNIDAFEATPEIVQAIHDRGALAIGYISTAYEEWRPDAGSFPAEVLGNPMDSWPGERWVDIRQWGLLQPVYESRLQMIVDKGFDAVEFDLMDAYSNNSGFPLTGEDQVRFNSSLAFLAKRFGLRVALKGDPEQAVELEPLFDFAINEQCLQYNECGSYASFIAAGKPVFHCEYNGTIEDICASAPVGFSSIRKRLGLGAWRESCADVVVPPPPSGDVPFGSRPAAGGTIHTSESDIIIENQHFNGRVNDQFIYRPSRGHNSHVCILTGGRNVTIRDCDFEDVSQPVAVIGGGNVTIENCRVRGIVGPGSRVDEQTGNFVQTVNSPDNVVVRNNKIVVYTDYDPWGGAYERFTEDVISFFSASDSAAIGNRIDATGYVRDSGTGIIAGDSHGARVRIEDNWLLNPGQVGIAIAGDPGHRVINNRIWKDADQHPGSGNTAAYCWDYNGGTPTDDVLFQGNRAKWNAGGGLWNPGPPPATTVDNNWDDDSLNRADFEVVL